ncbi:metal ABC transporter solute-binding protein, Zn/Mn family [Hoylesella oralis]|uniref:metal ABC transporter solute-binding protein, Zn/Mn family n=1 Tax=Hoylesella oralis TaxID=28134 RepID=UPI0028F15245|nr:zinc ABC transporter substrate-binding protein [Hoylesella oralis]
MNKNIGFFTVLTALLIAACTSGSPSDKRIITVTIEPLRYFTEQIAGDKFTVKTMVPRGGNPETYEPTARQMVDLSASDLYIKVGNIGFERTWMKRLEANAPHTIIINSSDGITSSDNSMYIHDPHTWMSTANAMYIARNIYKALAEIDSKDSLYFKKNLERLMGKIEAVDTQIREEITKDKSTTFLIYHPALTYFAQEYGLRQLSIEEDGREPSAVQLKQVINTARQNHVKIIFIQREFDSRNTDIVARSTGAEKVEINPLSYDWDKEMVKIAQSLK